MKLCTIINTAFDQKNPHVRHFFFLFRGTYFVLFLEKYSALESEKSKETKIRVVSSYDMKFTKTKINCILYIFLNICLHIVTLNEIYFVVFISILIIQIIFS